MTNEQEPISLDDELDAIIREVVGDIGERLQDLVKTLGEVALEVYMKANSDQVDFTINIRPDGQRRWLEQAPFN